MSDDLGIFMQKEIQDYIEKPKYNTCKNCENMAGNIYGESYYTKDNVRHTPIKKYCHCKIGGFEISFDATCSKHSNNVSNDIIIPNDFG